MAWVQINLLTNSVFSISALLCTVIYAILFLVLRISWNRIPLLTTHHSSEYMLVSVIIALRNETLNVDTLLSCLSKQTYPTNQTEIILVDDHSDIPLNEHPGISEHDSLNITIVTLSHFKNGKKEALLEGAQASNGELLLFTDADCRFGPEWIKSHVHIAQQSGLSLNIGLVDHLPSEKWISDFFNLDLRAMVMSGASMAYLKHPVFCSGANLAVSRTMYFNLVNYIKPHIPSGDDVFLLHSAKQLYPNNIHIIKSHNSLVYTSPPDTLLQFINQRIRWGSKAKYYTDIDSIMLSLLIAITSLLWITSVILSFLGKVSWLLPVIIFSLKTGADTLFLAAGSKFFKPKNKLWPMLIYELFYSIYISYTFTLGLFNMYHWKNR